MKIKKVEWYGFDHKVVRERFEGDVTFVNEMCLTTQDGKNYFTAAVYKAKKPDRTKGHKKYMLLFKNGDKIYVSGRDLKELKKDRIVDAIHCLECDVVMCSLARHHFHQCGCSNETFIDGGKDYSRCGAMNLKKTRMVKLDMLTDKIILDK